MCFFKLLGLAALFSLSLPHCRALVPIPQSYKRNSRDMSLQASTKTTTRLVTNTMCPFAQKAWIGLGVKHIPFSLQEISLYGAGGKPDWFWELNPQGTVPVLVVEPKANDRNNPTEPVVLPDSDEILDELDRLFPGQDDVMLYPPGLESEVDTWRRKRINQQLLPIGKQAVFSSKLTSQLDAVLRECNDAIVGPYLTGEQLNAADCHAFPFVWRLSKEFDLSNYPSLSQWVQTCSQHQAFAKTIRSSWWWWW